MEGKNLLAKVFANPRAREFAALTAVNVSVAGLRAARVYRKESPSLIDPELLTPSLALVVWLAYAPSELSHITKVIKENQPDERENDEKDERASVRMPLQEERLPRDFYTQMSSKMTANDAAMSSKMTAKDAAIRA